MNQEMEESVAAAEHGASQRLREMASVLQASVGGPLAQQVCRVPNDDRR